MNEKDEQIELNQLNEQNELLINKKEEKGLIFINEIEEVDHYDNKLRLIEILERLKKGLKQKDKKTITDVYLSYTGEKFMEDKELSCDCIGTKAGCSYQLCLFIIMTIYLTGSFIIISLKNHFGTYFGLLLSVFLVFLATKKILKSNQIFLTIFLINY